MTQLIPQGMNGKHPLKRMWHDHDLKDSYDVVIVGGGVHGLATAYYLARDYGITNVAVLEKRYIGGGNSGRNTAIIRSNYLTPEGVAFYDESVKLYQDLSLDLDYNVMFSQRGHLTLAHNDSALRTSRWRAEVNQLAGVDSRVVLNDELAKICPQLNLSEDVRHPIVGALYHAPGGIIRHNPVVWGYARGADSRGTHIHQNTEVTAIDTENGKVMGVQTTRGRIKTGIVVNQTAGFCTLISDMAGVRLPITSHQLQACVTEALKPFLDVVIVSGSLHVYVSQADRGELVMGASIDPYTSYSYDSTLGFLENLCQHMLELFPFLSRVKILRQWAGVCDMTPDFSPIMGFTPVEGFIVDVGWGTYGFKAGPVSGKRMAELIATQKTPDLLAPFSLSRFENGGLMGEKGAASVGH